MYFVKNCVGLMGAGSARKSFKVGNDQKCLKTTVQQSGFQTMVCVSPWVLRLTLRNLTLIRS